MDISITQFRAQCLELIRQVENGGEVVARLTPPSARSAQSPQPWTTLRGSGVLHAEPGEIVLEAQAFDARR
jgi:antitoxin (DNA-binding transcriptional repressor) of toxin-antitoxin stability system